MGYLFVAIAVLSGAVKGYCGKKTSGYAAKYSDAMFINMVRMILCIIIGAGIIFAQGAVSSLKIDLRTLFITALSGIATSVFVVSWLVSIKKGAYMMLDVFLMLGVFVTLILSYFRFGETIKITQLIGLAILFASVVIMCSYNNSIKEKMSVSALILLIICSVSSGIADFSQKLYVYHTHGAAAVFNFYTYIFSALTLMLFYAFSAKDSAASNGVSILKSTLFYVIVMAACLFINSFFKTKAASHLTSAQLYPLNQGAALIVGCIMSSVFFKEKLTLKAIVGICMAFASLLIINLL